MSKKLRSRSYLLLKGCAFFWLLCVVGIWPAAADEDEQGSGSGQSEQTQAVTEGKPPYDNPDESKSNEAARKIETVITVNQSTTSLGELDNTEKKPSDEASVSPAVIAAPVGIPSSAWMWILMLCLAVLSLVLVGLVLWLYLWRTRLRLSYGQNADGSGAPYVAVVAEKWEAARREQASAQDAQTGKMEEIKTTFNKLGKYSQSIAKKVEDVSAGFEILQNSLSKLEEENRKLKEGYDFSVLKRYMDHLIKIQEQLEECLEQDQIESDAVQQIKDDLSDIFSDAGIHSFAPQVGENFRAAFGVEDSPTLVETSNPSEDRTIESVVARGYHHEESGGVIKRARVRVFSYYPSQIKEDE